MDDAGLQRTMSDPGGRALVLAALNGLGDCSPAKPPAHLQEQIRSLLYEGRKLTPDDYRANIVTMKVQLLLGTLSAQVQYKVPAGFNLLIFGIRGHLALLDPMSETLAVVNPADATKGLGNLSLTDRMLMKAMNCQISLQNADRQINVFDNGTGATGAISLATILAAGGSGARALDLLHSPHIVPDGENLLLTSTLIKGAAANDAALVGGVTEYGVTLDSILVRTRGSPYGQRT